MWNEVKELISKKLFLYLQRRDFPSGPPVCLFCSQPFRSKSSKHYKITKAHLDNNTANNNFENIALAHWICNNNQKTYPEFQIVAAAKKRENMKYIDTEEKHQTGNENVELSYKLHSFTKAYLDKFFLNPKVFQIDLEDASLDISNLCYQKFRCGNSTTIIKHLRICCSLSSPYRIDDVEGSKIIVRRE